MPYRLIILLTLFIFGCTPFKVKTLYDEKFDFSQFQNFCWMNGCEFNIQGPGYLQSDTATMMAFMREIRGNLEKKGFRYEDETPDFVINLHIVAFEKQIGPFTPYHIYGRENTFTPFISEETYQYLEGSMIIDIADFQSSTVVWRTDVIGFTDSYPGFSKNTIQTLVSKALKRFPPE